jgi:aryl-alcohol dehydrogenase-like predicted oxidoreductase
MTNNNQPITNNFSAILRSLAVEIVLTTMSAALAWLLQRSPNMLLIPGTSSMAHLRENGANGMSDMAGKAARETVEPSGSERDTMLLALAFNCLVRQLRN